MNTEELIERYAKGDRQALGELYSMYHEKMVQAISRITGDEETARDIAHDGFIIVMRSIGTLRDAAKAESWMHRIMTNLALRHMQERKETSRISDSCEPADEADIPPEEIADMIERLPDGYRKVFKLSVLEGLSHNEIAGMLGIAPRSSSSQLARARASLQRMVERYISRMTAVVMAAIVSVASLMLYDGNRRKQAQRQGRRAERQPSQAVSRHTADNGSRHADPTDRRLRVKATTTADDATVCLTAMPKATAGVAIAREADDSLTVPHGMPGLDVTAPEPPYPGNSAPGHPRRSDMALNLSSAAGQASGSLLARVLQVAVPDVGSGAGTRAITTWEELNHYITYEADGNMNPLEREAIRRISIGNEGRIITQRHFGKPVTFGINLTPVRDKKGV